MPKWMKVPPPVEVLDNRTQMPIAELVFEDKDGERHPKLDKSGQPVAQVMPPWTLLTFMDRYLFASAYLPGGAKGARIVRRVRRSLREAKKFGEDTWALIDETDAEEVRKAFERAEKNAEAEMANPKAVRAWEPSILSQLVEMFDCWERSTMRDNPPSEAEPT